MKDGAGVWQVWARPVALFEPVCVIGVAAWQHKEVPFCLAVPYQCLSKQEKARTTAAELKRLQIVSKITCHRKVRQQSIKRTLPPGVEILSQQQSRRHMLAATVWHSMYRIALKIYLKADDLGSTDKPPEVKVLARSCCVQRIMSLCICTQRRNLYVLFFTCSVTTPQSGDSTRRNALNLVGFKFLLQCCSNVSSACCSGTPEQTRANGPIDCYINLTLSGTVNQHGFESTQHPRWSCEEVELGLVRRSVAQAVCVPYPAFVILAIAMSLVCLNDGRW